MSKFKKFEIDPQTFDNLCKKAWKAYFYECNGNPFEDFKKSLEKTFFDVGYSIYIDKATIAKNKNKTIYKFIK